MKTILSIAAVMALGGAGYAISAAGENPASGASTSHASCCAGKNMATAESGATCCKKGSATAVKTAANTTHQGQEVTLTGKILCEHCDLHVAAACAPALKAEGREGYLKVCPTSKGIAEMEKAGSVEVKGYVRPGPDGRDEIEIISFNKRPSKT
jgi:hypothetical protein